MNYSVTLTKPTKAYESKFSVGLQFETELEFSDLYVGMKRLNLDAKYSKARQIFYIPVNRDSCIGIIKLRQTFEVGFSVEAEEVFNNLREEALAEIKIRNHESEVVERLKELYAENSPLGLKHYISKTPMYLHQKYLFALHTKVRKSFSMADPGCGKTLSVIAAMDHRIAKGEVKKVVVVVPNHLKYKWTMGEGAEVEKHSNRKGVVLDGNKKQRLEIIRRFNNDPRTHFLVTGYSFWSGTNLGNGRNKNDDEYQLICNGPTNAFVCDESHKLKNYKANATKNVLKWLNPMEYSILMSGSPIPNALFDVFSQYLMIDPSVYGTNYYSFLKKYFKQGNSAFGGDWKIKSNRHREVLLQKSTKKALHFRTDQCLDLPPAIEEIIRVPETTGYLDELYNLSSTNIQELMDAGLKSNGVLSKLLIAANGYTYGQDEEGNRVVHEFADNPKIDALEDLVTNIVNCQGKGIIWSVWQFDEILIRRLLDRLHYKYVVINRFDRPEERIKKVKEYDKDPTMTFLVTSPKILAQGVDIFSPAYSIFFSVNFEWEPILQSKARNRRLGSDKFHKTIFYYTIVLAGSVEDEVAKALKEKKSMKDTVFGAARNVITRIKAFRKKRN